MNSPKINVNQLTLYNPGRLDDEEIIAAFVARRKTFENVLADVTGEKPKSRAQHHLIVGQRGMGKSTLLARLAAELRTDESLKQRFVPLVFVEEQYAVDRLSKFWLNCLDSLADAAERAGDTAASDAIDARVRALKPQLGGAAKQDEAYAAAALQTFLQAAAKTGKRPVLLVDNLQLVFERIAKVERHALRELLMQPGAPILIGASPTPPSETQDYGDAFYEHFKTHYLRPLSAVDMRDLMLKLAETTARDDVRDKVLAHPVRLKALRDLTGGNPRTVVTLFFLYAEDFSPSVFADLENLLDRVTPLYKARIEELSEQQQVIVSAIADHWAPISARDVATATGLPMASVPAQLERLENIGFVEKVELFGQASVGFQIAERFFNVWFLMRSASRRQRREVEFLVRFIECFYEAQDRPRLAQQLMQERDFTADRLLFARALAHTLDPSDKEELARHAELDALRQKAADARAKLEEVIDFSALPPATVAFDELRERLTALIPPEADISPEEFAEVILGNRQMFMRWEREKLATTTGKLRIKAIKMLLRSIADSRASDVREYGELAVEWVQCRLSTGQLRSSEDTEDWNRSFLKSDARIAARLLVDTIDSRICDKLSESAKSRICEMLAPTRDNSCILWADYGLICRKLGLSAAAESAYRHAIALEPEMSGPWVLLGSLFEYDMNRSEEAESAFRTAIGLNPCDSFAWTELANLLSDRADRLSDAETAFQTAIKLNSKNAITWRCFGNLLHYHLNRLGEAESAYRKAIKLNPRYEYAWQSLGDLLLCDISRLNEAEFAYRKTIEIVPRSIYPWIALGDLLRDDSGRFEEAEAAYRNAIEIDDSNSRIRCIVICLRRDHLGDPQSAKADFDFLRNRNELAQDRLHLHEALFAVYDMNWGLCRDALGKALYTIHDRFPANTLDDWIHATAVLVHLNYAQDLLTLLRERGDDAKLRPWYEAIVAIHQGDRRYLENVPVEVRSLAEQYFDEIEKRLKTLPEKTRRRQLPKPPKKSRSTKSSRRKK